MEWFIPCFPAWSRHRKLDSSSPYLISHCFENLTMWASPPHPDSSPFALLFSGSSVHLWSHCRARAGEGRRPVGKGGGARGSGRRRVARWCSPDGGPLIISTGPEVCFRWILILNGNLTWQLHFYKGLIVFFKAKITQQCTVFSLCTIMLLCLAFWISNVCVVNIWYIRHYWLTNISKQSQITIPNYYD